MNRMNSKGVGIANSQRVANMPMFVSDNYNPRNQTNVLSSFSNQPRAPQITNYGEGNPQLQRGHMNDVNFNQEFKDEELRKAVVSVVPVRRKNLLSNFVQAPMFPVPNDRNNSTQPPGAVSA